MLYQHNNRLTFSKIRYLRILEEVKTRDDRTKILLLDKVKNGISSRTEGENKYKM